MYCPKRLLALLVLFLFSFNGFSQSITPSTLNVSGNSYHSPGYYFEWSIGEMSIVETFAGNGTFVVTNGVLQPLTNIISATNLVSVFLKPEIRIYPTPTKDWVFINVITPTQGNLQMKLTNMAGQVLWSKASLYNGQGSILPINLAAYAAGNYTISIELLMPHGSVTKKSSYVVSKIN